MAKEREGGIERTCWREEDFLFFLEDEDLEEAELETDRLGAMIAGESKEGRRDGFGVRVGREGGKGRIALRDLLLSQRRPFWTLFFRTSRSSRSSLSS